MKAVHQNRFARAKQPGRPGFALVGVLVCLVAASLLLVTWLKTVTLERQQARVAEQRLQAELLAEAALDRAAARLSEKADYAGETWKLSAEEISGRDAATVEIRVAAVADRPDRRTIEVVADYPVDPVRRARASKQIIIDLGKMSGESGAAKPNSSKTDGGK
jgi:Tfp pilus assembly protein PilX